MSRRIEEELDLLRTRWGKLGYREEGRWVLLPGYSLPDCCVQDEADIAFQIKAAHPGDAPYGFYVCKPIELVGGAGFKRTSPANDPPFLGEWLKFSWAPADWQPSADLRAGSNLLDWALSFRERLAQGA